MVNVMRDTVPHLTKLVCPGLKTKVSGNIVAETLFPTNVSPCFQEWANTRKH